MCRNWLRDDQWERIKELLPGKSSDRGVTAADNRKFVEAELWILVAARRSVDQSIGFANPLPLATTVKVAELAVTLIKEHLLAGYYLGFEKGRRGCSKDGV